MEELDLGQRVETRNVVRRKTQLVDDLPVFLRKLFVAVLWAELRFACEHRLDRLSLTRDLAREDRFLAEAVPGQLLRREFALRCLELLPEECFVDKREQHLALIQLRHIRYVHLVAVRIERPQRRLRVHYQLLQALRQRLAAVRRENREQLFERGKRRRLRERLANLSRLYFLLVVLDVLGQVLDQRSPVVRVEVAPIR